MLEVLEHLKNNHFYHCVQTCHGTGFGIGTNPCSAWPDTKTRSYFGFSDTSQSMFRPRPIHGPIPKHGRTFGSPIPPNPCTEHLRYRNKTVPPHVLWTSFQYKSCLQWINIDVINFFTRLYSVVITNSRVVNEFWLFEECIDHFWQCFSVKNL